jgi:hypothetical protein
MERRCRIEMACLHRLLDPSVLEITSSLFCQRCPQPSLLRHFHSLTPLVKRIVIMVTKLSTQFTSRGVLEYHE